MNNIRAQSGANIEKNTALGLLGGALNLGESLVCINVKVNVAKFV